MKQDRDRILLVEPPFYRLFKDTYSLDRYPLSLGYLAGEIRTRTDWDVMVYNADFTPENESIKVSYLSGAGFNNYLTNLRDPSGAIWKEIERTIREYAPSVVGISAKSQNFTSARMVAGLAKGIDGRTIVIMGGPHPSMVGGEVLRHPEIDVCVSGEGEETVVELLNTIGAGDGLDDIRGIVHKKDGRIVENSPREFIEDLDSLCFPHQSAPEVLKDYAKYPVTAFKSVFATRGCPYNCFFCGSRNIWSRKVRFRSPENVAEEINGLRGIGLRRIHFDDDTFGVTGKYISDLCGALKLHCPGLKWSCEMPVQLVDERNVSAMKSAGCFSIQLGVESGNDEILSEIRKNITIAEALDACRLIKKHGIELQVFFIIGFPQETEDTVRDTISAMKKTRCDMVCYSIFTPYPGTEAFELCRERGLIGDDYDVSLYNHHSPVNSFCANIAPERFRALVSEAERKMDTKNSLNRIKRIFSLGVFDRMRELGVRESLRRGLKVLAGR